MRHPREVPHLLLGLVSFGKNADQITIAVIVLAPELNGHQRKISWKKSCKARQEAASASAL